VGLADVIANSKELNTPSYRQRCTVRILLENLEDPDRDAFKSLLATDYEATRIVRMMREWGQELVAENPDIYDESGELLNKPTTKGKDVDQQERIKRVVDVCFKVTDPTIRRHRANKCSCRHLEEI
jgi:hypothetical protein